VAGLDLNMFLSTFEQQLRGASSCVNDGALFHEKITKIETILLSASPELVEQFSKSSASPEQIIKIKQIIDLLEAIELQSNSKLMWFDDLSKHLKQTLANDV